MSWVRLVPILTLALVAGCTITRLDRNGRPVTMTWPAPVYPNAAHPGLTKDLIAVRQRVHLRAAAPPPPAPAVASKGPSPNSRLPTSQVGLDGGNPVDDQSNRGQTGGVPPAQTSQGPPARGALTASPGDEPATQVGSIVFFVLLIWIIRTCFFDHSSSYGSSSSDSTDRSGDSSSPAGSSDDRASSGDSEAAASGDQQRSFGSFDFSVKIKERDGKAAVGAKVKVTIRGAVLDQPDTEETDSKGRAMFNVDTLNAMMTQEASARVEVDGEVVDDDATVSDGQTLSYTIDR